MFALFDCILLYINQVVLKPFASLAVRLLLSAEQNSQINALTVAPQLRSALCLLFLAPGSLLSVDNVNQLIDVAERHNIRKIDEIFEILLSIDALTLDTFNRVLNLQKQIGPFYQIIEYLHRHERLDKDYLHTLLAVPESLIWISMAVDSLYESNILQEDDIDFLIKHQQDARVIAIFLDEWESVHGRSPRIDRTYADFLLKKINNKQAMKIGELIEESINLVLSNKAENEIPDLKISDLKYFSSFVKKYYKSRYPQTQMPIEPVSVQFLTGDKGNPNIDKPHALRRIYSALIELFKKPALCAYFLRELERDIVELCSASETSLPKDRFSSEHLENFEHMGLSYLVPKESFKPISYGSLLKQSILKRLRTYGLGEKVVKFYGLIPAEDIKSYIQAGAYFSENTLDYAMLLHGKTIHMLQMIMVCEMIRAGVVDTRYVHEGVTHQLTEKDILAFLVDGLENGRWNKLLDDARFSIPNNMSNPYFASSFLMACGNDHQLPNLRALMINSFSKSFLKIPACYRDIFKDDSFSLDDLKNHVIKLTRPSSLLEFNQASFIAYQYKNNSPVQGQDLAYLIQKKPDYKQKASCP